jgi:sugar-specific transcriptional regulator TrmB
MKEETLMEVGLSKNEAKVYLALLELGSATGGKISELSKVHRTNVYDALERLIEKGFVGYCTKDNKKCFETTDPNNLMNLLKEKELHLQNIMPQLLLAKQMSRKAKIDVFVAEGLKAVKDSKLRQLKIKMPIHTMGSPKTAADVAKPFLLNFHKQRIELKIEDYLIYNNDANKEYLKRLNSMPYTHVKVLPPKLNAPISTNICGDEVTIKLWEKGEATVIIIKSEKVAQTYRNYHKMLWESAEDI